MADTRIETSEHDEIQELSKGEMEQVTGGRAVETLTLNFDKILWKYHP